MPGSIPLWLDHASIAVPELADAVAHLDDRLGLRATVSPATPERHSRVYLDRGYLEVAARPGDTGWTASLFFLRFDDPEALRGHLEAVGLAYRFGAYEGVDGTWDDVEIDAGEVPLPILVRRTAPAEIAQDWPPALPAPHRCGARTLAQVHVGVPSLEPAIEAYERLLGLEAAPATTVDPRSGRSRATLPAASGEVVLLDAGTGEIERIVLGVGSLEKARTALGERLTIDPPDPVAWLDPADAFGLELGFVEA
ncbi:MAG TPA: VOC family protein [Actinomycetota bacterium]|nr:VOC family protein [Actinomycetota bacterium]